MKREKYKTMLRVCTAVYDTTHNKPWRTTFIEMGHELCASLHKHVEESLESNLYGKLDIAASASLIAIRSAVAEKLKEYVL